MTAVDPSAHQYRGYMEKFKFLKMSQHDKYLQEKDMELKVKMQELGIQDMKQFYKWFAIKCEEFLFYCEYKDQLYTSRRFLDLLNLPGKSCCEVLFDFDNPIFINQAGTCFSSNATLIENIPGTSSKISIYPLKQHSPSQLVIFGGGFVGDQKNIKWVVTDKDAPGYWLFTKPQKVPESGMATVSLSLRKTITHHVSINGNCKEKDHNFEQNFGVPYTYNNCKMVPSHIYIPNCSIGILAGLDSPQQLKPCMPMDTIMFDPNLKVKNIKTGFKVFGDAFENCALDCVTEGYKTSISYGVVDTMPLRNFLRRMMSFMTLTDEVENILNKFESHIR